MNFGLTGSPPAPGVPSQIDDATALVGEVLTESRGLAAQSATRGLAAIAALGNFDVAIPALELPTFDIPVLDAPAPGTPPADPGDLGVVLPPLPPAPAQGPLGVISVGEAPEATLVPPLLADIPLPDPLSVVVPAAPVLAEVGAPAEPDYALPEVPQFVALNLPDAPVFEIEPFDEPDPQAPTAPDVQFVWNEVAYRSDELAALNARLLDLVGGAATGLAPEVENAIWHKGCDSEAMLTYAAVDSALNDSAARGFSIPGGQLVRVVQQAIDDALAKDAELSRATMVEAVRLEQQNFQFAFGQALALETRLIELFNQVQERALDAARFRSDAMIELFNARVSLYEADVRAFGVKVDVFKARLEAALARLDLYKAELEGVKLRGELNVQLAHQYSAQVEAVKAATDIFKARVEAVKLSVSTNKNRTELYKAEIEAYAALVKGNGELVKSYLARVQAEQAKAQVFGQQVAAYTARVEAYRVLTDAKLADVTFQVRQLQEFPMELYRARIGAYQSQVGAEAARLAATADVFQLRVEGFAAVERANAQYGTAQADAAATTTRLYASKAQIALQDGMNKIKLAQLRSETAQSALRAAGQLTTQLASAAMSARNVSASLTGSTSNSAGVSASVNQSVSNSVSNSSSASVSKNFSATTGINNSASVAISHSQSSSNNQTWSDSVDQSVSNSTSHSASNETSRGVRNSTDTSARISDNATISTLYQHRR
jgi:hypothetical protein